MLETLKVSGQGDGIWQIVRLLVKLMSCVLWQISRSTEHIAWLLVDSLSCVLCQVSRSTEHTNWLLVDSRTCIR